MENQTATTFGMTKDGKEAQLYLLKNQKGMKAYVSDFGASLVRLFVPDRDGNMTDVVLGYDDAAGYERGTAESVPLSAEMPTGSAGRRLRSTA